MAAWDPNAFAQVVGRAPSQAETDYYSKAGDAWLDEVKRNTPGYAQQGQASSTPAAAPSGDPNQQLVQLLNQGLTREQAVAQLTQQGVAPGTFNIKSDNSIGYRVDPNGVSTGYVIQGPGGQWQYGRSGFDLAGNRMPAQGGGGGGAGAGDWWSGQGVSPGELSSYGVPGSPYTSQAFSGGYTPPTAPGVLGQQYALPTQAELENTPGYQARLKAAQQGLERGAAAKGSILSGGFVNAEGKAMQDYASNEYNNLVGQQLGARQQNQGEFQQNVMAPGQFQYQNQYKQYLDEQNRTLNDYLTNYNINRTGIQDFLTQQNRTADRGLSALTAGAPRY